MKWTIRSPDQADQEALADIYLAVRRETFAWVEPLAFRHQDFFAHTQGEIVWLAETPEGEIAGFMTLWAPDDFIHMLYIRKDWQGKGAGTALLRALPNWPRQKYRLKCLVRNARAKAFYLANGFRVTAGGTSAEGDYDEMSFIPAI
ncbi:GNAT family N-acetyltransferase [Rhizobium sp. Root1220]|uniref:GNAT family N-acetyltransferase n=1 Tax=Rhizobium sp. Root1220 TaxID=1736432 RepID=UPI0006FDEC69|nr:GNAT family N-acetyltransferase [Rhizobium sp. Root1220]KQV84517.1 acetyltransferase [Rhizobium sp. Root1220]